MTKSSHLGVKTDLHIFKPGPATISQPFHLEPKGQAMLKQEDEVGRARYQAFLFQSFADDRMTHSAIGYGKTDQVPLHEMVGFAD